VFNPYNLHRDYSMQLSVSVSWVTTSCCILDYMYNFASVLLNVPPRFCLLGSYVMLCFICKTCSGNTQWAFSVSVCWVTTPCFILSVQFILGLLYAPPSYVCWLTTPCCILSVQFMLGLLYATPSYVCWLTTSYCILPVQFMLGLLYAPPLRLETWLSSFI